MESQANFGLFVFSGTILLLMVGFFIFYIAGFWKILKKAGKPGWHSIIPFLNIYDLYDICWKGTYGILTMILYVVMGIGLRITGYNSSSGTFQNPNTLWLVIILTVAITAFILQIIGMHKLSKAFGHEIGYTIGLIFLTPIFLLILGFGSSEYIGKDQPYDKPAE